MVSKKQKEPAPKAARRRIAKAKASVKDSVSSVKESVSRRVAGMLGIVTSVGRVVEQMAGLVGMRARAAGQNIFALMVLAFIFASLVTVIWVSLLVMLFFYLVAIQWTAFSAVAAIVVLNAILLLFVMYLIRIHKRHLSSSLGLGR